MAYKVYNCNRTDEESEDIRQSAKDTFKTLVNRIIFEEEQFITLQLCFPPPLGIEIDPQNGSLLGSYSIMAQNKPSLFWRVDNNILFINGLCCLNTAIQPTSVAMDCNPVQLSIPLTAVARLSSPLPENAVIELSAEFQGASLMGVPPSHPKCKSEILLNAAFLVKVLITSAYAVEGVNSNKQSIVT